MGHRQDTLTPTLTILHLDKVFKFSSDVESLPKSFPVTFIPLSLARSHALQLAGAGLKQKLKKNYLSDSPATASRIPDSRCW